MSHTSVRHVSAPLRRADIFDGGNFRLRGSVTVAGTAAARKVRLFDWRTGRLVREAWSDAAGQYGFDWIANRKYLVIAHDHLAQYNATVADVVIPVAMP